MAIAISSFFTGSGDRPRPVIAAAAVSPERVLQAQAAAFNRGDLAGWLAPVDPPLRDDFRALFRTLRALHVATVDYQGTSLSYCFAPCTGRGARPRLTRTLTMRAAGSTYRITGRTPPGAGPAPWEAGDLIFRQGRRVTVGAPRRLAARLAEVVAVADRAAATADRYAAMTGNPQTRYRIFLATDASWRTWYGGKPTGWAVGYMQPLGAAGADVVINPTRIHNRAALREVIQHELGHVATIGGVVPGGADMWLVEGVAEYIGAQPRRTAAGRSRMVTEPLPAGAGQAEAAAFYAHARLGVDCLVRRFGEPRVMEFVRLRLRWGESLDAAARGAFGRPFTAVNQACS